MIATRCSGTNACRHGTMSNHVLNLTVVLPNGEIIKTAQRARKSAAGYNLTQLFIGSEGTIGVVTEATLKLQIIPEKTSVAVVNFPTIKAATQAATHILQHGIQLGAVELMDHKYIDIINHVEGFNYDLKPTLFLKFTGNKDNVELDIKRTQRLIEDLHPEAGEFLFSKNDEERDKLWQARKAALWSCISYYSPQVCYITDVCVPISKSAEIISETQRDIDSSWLNGPIVAHIGDGNFHATIMFDPEKPGDLEEAKRLSHNMVHRAIALDGTCTGEHGIGVGKRQYLIDELGENTVNVMKSIKHAIDPHNIMNPGKIFYMDRNSKG
jgi:D-lactate dehydrogenase (cytochrome)